MSWTTNQQAAIDARGQNLLLSAGAGAGKTSTLVNRILRLITDPESGMSIDRMVIVTFTRAATMQMREKLAKTLREELAAARAEGGDRECERKLQAELNVLPRAQISTIHSLCATLLRENAASAGLSPDFDIMADEEARLLRSQAIAEAIERAVTDDRWETAMESVLRQHKTASALDAVVDSVMRLHGFLESLAEPRAFVHDIALAHYDELEDSSPDARAASAFFQLFKATVEEALRPFLTGADDLLRQFPASALQATGQKNYREGLAESVSQLRAWVGSFGVESDLAELLGLVAVPRKPRVTRNSSQADADMTALAGEVKELQKKAKESLQKLLRYPTAGDLLDELLASKPIVELFLVRLGLELSDALLERHLNERRLTYNQLERLARRVLVAGDGGPSDAARTFRRRTDAVFVDEFQDVSPLQASLLRAISRPGGDRDGDGNLFVVGDVKQSIYGFRQADPEQFLNLYRTYRDFDPARAGHPGARIRLLENFRSDPALLAAFNRLFEPLFSDRIGSIRYDEEHRFIAGLEPSAGDAGPRLHVHLLEKSEEYMGQAGDEDGPVGNGDGAGGAPGESSQDTRASESDRDAMLFATFDPEAVAVGNLIKQSGESPGRFAVLLRSATVNAAKIVDVLRWYNIPFTTQENIGFLVQQEVQDVIALLRVIDNPYREVELAGALRGPAGGWTSDDLLRLRLVNRQGRLFNNLKRVAGEESEGGAELAHRSREFLAFLRDFQARARRKPIAEFFGDLYNALRLRERVSVLANGDQRRLNLQFLQDRGVQFDSFRRKGLASFLAFLEDLVERGDDLGQTTPAPEGVDAVRVMTMHKSKGLEFPVVIAPYLGRKFNMRDLDAKCVWHPQHGFATRYVPGAVFGDDKKGAGPGLLRKPMRDKALGEELRLLYVACTRAEERLHLIGSRKKLGEWLDKQKGMEECAGESEVGDAACNLDWVVGSLRTLPAFRKLDPGLGNMSVTDADAGIAFHVRTDPWADADAGRQSDDQEADEARARLDACRGETRDAFERVRRIAARSHPVAVRSKVSVTEAKRAFDSLHSEDNPPRWHRRRGAPGASEPDWFPPALVPARATGARRGTIVHRFAALVDLDAVARGVALADELGRLVADGFFTEEEAGIIPLDWLDTFFGDGLGRRMLDNRARVRRETPFLSCVRAGELTNAAPRPEQLFLFQGVIDAWFEEGNRGGGPIVIVDFKTDQWDGRTQSLEPLEEAYKPQMQLYSVGLGRALGRPIDQGWLYFLNGGGCASQVDMPRSDAEWLPVLRAAAVAENGDGAGGPM